MKFLDTPGYTGRCMEDKEVKMSDNTHIERIPIDMRIDAHGNIIWNPLYRDYNETIFHRGKTVTNNEFNDLHKKSTYQGNYLADSLKAFFGKHLSSAIDQNVTTRLNTVRSYVKSFTSADWGTQQQDGYYYINIPASEHGFTIDTEVNTLERMNIAVQMFLLDSNNDFYEVNQIEIDTSNNVTIYTDDNTLIGFVVIKINNKAYTLINEQIDASFIDGLADVSLSGKYADLIDINDPTGPNTRLTALETAITNLSNGTTLIDFATNSTNATNAERLLSTSLIQGVSVADIFETGSGIVKNATNATKVNNLEIVRDTNGVLKIGDTVIPQRKLLWSGNKDIGVYVPSQDMKTIATLSNLNNKIVEITTNRGLFFKFKIQNNFGNFTQLINVIGDIDENAVYGDTLTIMYYDNTFIGSCYHWYYNSQNPSKPDVYITAIYEVVE